MLYPREHHKLFLGQQDLAVSQVLVMKWQQFQSCLTEEVVLLQRQEVSAGHADRSDSTVSSDWESSTHFNLKTNFNSLTVRGILTSLKGLWFLLQIAQQE